MPKRDDMILQAFSKFEKKLDLLDSRLDSVDKTLVKQEANLGEHMRRTELNEKRIETAEIEADKKVESVRKALAPVEKHVAYMEGALKGLGVIATMIAVIGGLIKIFS